MEREESATINKLTILPENQKGNNHLHKSSYDFSFKKKNTVTSEVTSEGENSHTSLSKSKNLENEQSKGKYLVKNLKYFRNVKLPSRVRYRKT